ncbi:MAG: DnaD domain protein [Bacilli bacterium]|nr:DnaD domain protein [Bacilli bacterium]
MNINDLIKVNDSFIIPNYVIKNYEKLGLEGLDFIMLIYFINQKNNVTFDVNKIATDLNLESSKVLEIINSLNEKNFISIEMKKNNGVIEEYISTELFYNKVSSMLMENLSSEKETDLYSVFEKEFGRTLSPTEFSSINNWIENGISEDLIREALKEAILSGVHNIRYIDTILFNWTKKGYKKPEDVKRKKEDDEEIVEVYDYDWLNE